ncbi:ABC transporter substrate-binding protein [Oceanobacillus arenosus]|uniref:ABC transporter substrate-binding protein n=1 Tax=Oceanobacillus arenosus TaxID=1229153 RepID=A0A3D8Q325_9BACI|nr:sugar ABC transporter substrate-binding protein [Oceanobacillus arenosus]RDW21505.1 ABC transporter substrate-binding protein [Oceanobacillus arenosus]
MMKKKKLGWLSAILFSGALILGACSDDSSGDEGTDSTSSGDDTIQVWTMSADFDKFVAEFEDESGINVEVQTIPWGNVHDKLLTAVASGKGPDVIQIGTTWVAEFAEAGTFLDLTDHIADYPNLNPDNFFDAAVESTQYNGQTVGIPWYVDTRLLFYRTDLLAEAGYPEGPETWDDFLDAATQLTARGDDQYGVDISQGDPQFPFMLAWERGFKYDEAKGSANFEDPAFVDAVKLHNQFFKDDLAQLTEGKELYQAFSDGSKPMFFSGPWEINSINTQIPELEGKWDVHVMPKAENNNSMIGGSHLGIFHNSDNVEGSLKFIDWMADPETQIKWFENIKELPANTTAWENPVLADDPMIATFGEQLESTQAVPVIPEFEKLAQELIKTLEQINHGGADIDASLADFRSEAARILGE